MDYGFLRACAVSPTLRPGDVGFNTDQIVIALTKAAEGGASLVLFPELCVTGYTCADLFHQDLMIDEAATSLNRIASSAQRMGVIAVVGLPVSHDGVLWNCAAVLSDGGIAGLVPKSYLPNYKEYYEGRWFSSGAQVTMSSLPLNGAQIPFGSDLLFEVRREGSKPVLFGIEVCEDLWMPLPPSSLLALRGALLLLNPSASTEIVGKADYRRDLVATQSGRCVASYLYAAAGPTESTTDVVFSGHCLAAEYGVVLGESERFSRKTEYLFADFDPSRLDGERRRLTTFSDQAALARSGTFGGASRIVPVLCREWQSKNFKSTVDRLPFVPRNAHKRDERCREIFSIQVAALAKRVEHTASKTLVIGISGGLDSTLALLVAVRTLDLLNRPRKDVLAITMPGFGTTGTTLTNARGLMDRLGVTSREIDIKPACLTHFADIGHDPTILNTTYENVQARERTQILMDLANASGGMVVGTGDLSEAALGWSTYNGDHMSMYAVNCSVPKTLVKHLVSWVAEHETDKETATVLAAVIGTPISPELLPPDEKGEIAQKTEDLVGPYELHDFFLYHHVRWGSAPKKILFLAQHAFSGAYDEATIRKWLLVFYKRFFSQQFKRSCVPDGPKVGSISLSPRGDWRMPSDASAALWLTELK
ncbi:MAG: NAD(+) synthase [Treponemataceae bacterium]